MAQQVLIEPTKAAAISEEMQLAAGSASTLLTDAPPGEEPLTIEFLAGGSWHILTEQVSPAAQVHGSFAQLSHSNNVRQLTGPITVRVQKPETTKPVGLWLET